MTARTPAQAEDAPPRSSLAQALSRPLAWPRALWDAVGQRASSSLTRRIVVLNLVGLIALLVGFLYLNQFRQGLIQARIQSLAIQGEIIAGAIAASASVDTDTIRIDPDKLLQQQAGEAAEEESQPLAFSLNPEKVAPLLSRLVTPTGNRARVYDQEGGLLFDTRTLFKRGDAGRPDPLAPRLHKPGMLESAFETVQTKLGGLFRTRTEQAEETGPVNGHSLREVQAALGGNRGSLVRRNKLGETTVSVAVPIHRAGSVRGALLISTQGDAIDRVIASERFGLLQVFLVASAVMVVLSFLLAGRHRGPGAPPRGGRREGPHGHQDPRGNPGLHRAHRRDRPPVGGAARHDAGALPAHRRDRELRGRCQPRVEEPAHLPAQRRGDAAAGQERRFARPADGDHPARRETPRPADQRHRRRLAPRCRAGARRGAAGRSAPSALHGGVGGQRAAPSEGLPDPPRYRVPGAGVQDAPFTIIGHDSRLGQVVNNLLDNARSFSPSDAKVRVVLRRVRGEVELICEDEGPGIPEHALERIFERFYTDRPEQGFGQNSGLGLSISRQIVQAHRGTIRAENRPGAPDEDGEPTVRGARFIVRLPAAPRQLHA